MINNTIRILIKIIWIKLIKSNSNKIILVDLMINIKIKKYSKIIKIH